MKDHEVRQDILRTMQMNALLRSRQCVPGIHCVCTAAVVFVGAIAVVS